MRLHLAVALCVVVGTIGLAAQKPALIVPLKFVPQGKADITVALPPSVLDVPVALTLVDGRQADAARTLGTGTDDDDRPFPIESSIDVLPFVEQAVGQLLDLQRITRNASAGRRLELRLTRFNVDESNKALGSTYTAEVHLAYQLKGSGSAPLAEGAAAGTSNRYGRARSGANCAEVLSDALRDAVVKMLADQGLQTAWRTGAAKAAVR